jgi:hypothetical protein
MEPDKPPISMTVKKISSIDFIFLKNDQQVNTNWVNVFIVQKLKKMGKIFF